MVMFVPMSSAFASIDYLFNKTSSDSQSNIEFALDYENTHDALELYVDGSSTFLEESDIHDILFSDSSHDNQGSGGSSVSISSQVSPDSAEWNHVLLDNGARYEIVSVPLPAEIRPPIHS